MNCCAGSSSSQSRGPGKSRKGFKTSVASPIEEIVAVAQQKVAVFEHPQVAHTVVHGPQRLGLHRALRQREHHGANLAFVASWPLQVAVQQAGDAEGEQQTVFVEKIERGQGVARAQVDSAGRV